MQSALGRKRRRAWEAVAISLAFHAVVFLAVGLIAPKPGARFIADTPPVNIVLLPPIPRERVHRTAPQPSKAASPQDGDAKAHPLAIHAARDVRPSVQPSPLAAPAQPGPPATPSGIGTSHAPGPLPYEDSATGVRAFLRGTVGCDYTETAHLTAEEKQRCANRFANMERKAPEFSAIPGEKLGGFMAEAAANARRRTAHDQSVPMSAPVVSCDGPGSNLGGGCLPPEAIHHYSN